MADLIPIRNDSRAIAVLQCGHSKTLVGDAVPFYRLLISRSLRIYCIHCPIGDGQVVIDVIIHG